jgi:hypothetical protein
MDRDDVDDGHWRRAREALCVLNRNVREDHLHTRPVNLIEPYNSANVCVHLFIFLTLLA